MSQAVVLFPGVRYSCDTPLLYYAGTVFTQRGYEKYEIAYPSDMLSNQNLEQKARNAQADVLEQIRKMHLEKCEDVVFVSKSIGTVLAGWTASQLDYSVRHIYLTPLEPTLPYINPAKDMAVGAGTDPYLDAERLRSYCAEHRISLTMFPEVGHRLEDRQDIHRTLSILSEIVRIYESF